MTSVLVTGGLGHIGLHTARDIARRGDRAILFDKACAASVTEQKGDAWGDVQNDPIDPYWFTPTARHILGDMRDKVVPVRGDILDFSELTHVIRRYDVTKIVNCAALFNPVIAYDNPMEAFRNNVAGAVNVFEAARVLGVGRLVHLSTIAVSMKIQYEPVDEKHPLFDIAAGSPSGPHGSVKAAAEILGMTYYSAYGVDFVALRTSAVYGFGMGLPTHIRPMVEYSVRGKECIFPKGDMRRDYVYIDDAVDGIISALYTDKPLKQRIFTLGSGVITSTVELGKIVEEVIPGARIKIGGGMSGLEESNIKMRGRLSIEAAREQLGYNPRFDLPAGIKAFADEVRKFDKETANRAA
jgi:nucleoside-diphosphate-sugar epimerase